MKKILIFLFLFAIAFACNKDKEEDVVLTDEFQKTEQIQSILLDLPPNPPPGEIGELAPSFIEPKTFENLILKNGEVVESSLDPAEVEKSLKDGHSFTESKVAHIEPAPPKGDIMFAFDLTGSMYGAINSAKTQSGNIMAAINAIIPDTEFGVISHMDYNGFYDYCGYAASYGSGSDYPYSLDQALTANTTDVSNAINGLILGSGDDGAENYTRVLYETVADGAIGWRENSKKIVIAFLDNIPHDCALGTGVDPGRDAVAGTADDLVLANVLNMMAEENITLIVVDSYGGVTSFWDDKAHVTGGDAYTLGTDIVETVETLIEEEVMHLDDLTLEVCTPGFEDWMSDLDPGSYFDVELPGDFDFEVEFTVPEGTDFGVYDFQVCAVGEGVIYATQDVTITVYKEVPLDVHPEGCPNPLNREGMGWTPMALLGTADFDVSEVNPESIRIKGVAPVKWNMEDVGTPYMPFVDKPLDAYECNEIGPDGMMDLTLKFKTQELAPLFAGAEIGDVVVLTLTGELLDGTKLIGEDVLIVVK